MGIALSPIHRVYRRRPHDKLLSRSLVGAAILFAVIHCGFRLVSSAPS